MAQNNGDHNGGEDPIDANLKRVFDDMLNQEVPDRFKDLLQQLKSQDSGASRNEQGDNE